MFLRRSPDALAEAVAAAVPQDTSLTLDQRTSLAVRSAEAVRDAERRRERTLTALQALQEAQARNHLTGRLQSIIDIGVRA